MKRSHAVLIGPFFLSLLAIAFCLWSAFGNDVNFCVTTGCTLYQDFTIAGVSLWWFGTAAFTLLGVCALLGQSSIGFALAALFLIGDIGLLALMAFTAPCISCMTAAVFLALSYYLFRRADNSTDRHGQQSSSRPSFLLAIWLVFFIIDIGQVARSQADVWPIMDESGEARSRMFFSPSCPTCVEGVNTLSGRVDMAFYPVADNDQDVYRIAKMISLLNDGMGLSEALGQSMDADATGFFSSISPDIIWLRFRLLRNKAHIFASGSQGVPFFEYKGLPPDVLEKARERIRNLGVSNLERRETSSPRDASLPIELQGGQCIGSEPCPPVVQQ